MRQTNRYSSPVQSRVVYRFPDTGGLSSTRRREPISSIRAPSLPQPVPVASAPPLIVASPPSRLRSGRVEQPSTPARLAPIAAATRMERPRAPITLGSVANPATRSDSVTVLIEALAAGHARGQPGERVGIERLRQRRVDPQG